MPFTPLRLVRKFPENTMGAIVASEYKSKREIAISAPGVNTADSPSPVVQPSANTVPASRILLGAPTGTYVTAQLVYSAGLTTITDPILRCWGRLGQNGEFELLKTRAGGTSIALSTSAQDAVSADGLFKRTVVDSGLHVWPLLGNDQYVFTVDSALSASSGDVTTAYVLSWVI